MDLQAKDDARLHVCLIRLSTVMSSLPRLAWFGRAPQPSGVLFHNSIFKLPAYLFNLTFACEAEDL